MSSPQPDRFAATTTSYRTDFAGGTIRAKLVDLGVRATVKSIIGLWARYPYLPWPYHLVDFIGAVLPSPKGLARTRVMLDHCPAVLTTPKTVDLDRFVVYLHGGGFLVGGRRLHRQMTGRFASDLRSRVLAVTYRKLPDHPIATSIADAVDGYRYALRAGIRPENITLMGDSAGGYLVLMAAIEIRRQGLPMPAAVVAMSPLTDWDMSEKLAAPTATECAVFTAASLPRFRELAEKAAAGTPLESPATCDLTALPPTLIQASSSEMLYPDAVLIARRLREHGVACELQVWPGQVHVFQAGVSVVPEAATAVAEIGTFLRRAAEVAGQERSA
ncbi:alpha/beta hydrolase [Nocardia spumae]|uniref:alpha/beta hydrolase n=1 Tax=Nocardia spumae TaxID=2887190 RepID=UPI001D150EAE|nr:alpha/beta hydrolase [Nocardia spumae]